MTPIQGLNDLGRVNPTPFKLRMTPAKAIMDALNRFREYPLDGRIDVETGDVSYLVAHEDFDLLMQAMLGGAELLHAILQGGESNDDGG